ncbi:MAG: cytidylyltransferase domain-containing protein [Treponemataceae bacterium]
MKILVIIPARGGSKGIPKKNIRLMNGKPLISYAISTALDSKFVTDVYVSTDSIEIADISKKFGSQVLIRDSSLAGDVVTLDPVIYDGMKKAEALNGFNYDAIITMQPTSPLTSVETLNDAIEYFINGKFDTLISVVNKPHLSWQEKDNKIIPNYKERLNRQLLPKNYLETGAFLIVNRKTITDKTRIGKNIGVFEVPEREAIDIDDVTDWVMTETLMKRKKILFRADGYVKLGMGHIYNCITLAYSMIEHEVLFVTNEDCQLGIKKIEESKLHYVTIKNEDELFSVIEDYKPDIFINDCLDTQADYILRLKKKVPRVVTIEDIGTGAYKADAVVNALYENPENATKKFYSGYKYVCLRDEFMVSKNKEFSPDVKNVIVLFGGTDPSNLNKKTYQAVMELTDKFPEIKFYFITGIGYDYEKQGVVSNEKKNIFVCPNVPMVTKYMQNADLAITSQGRTIYELASLGIPAIVLSQNERELTHNFANMKHGFLNLGLGCNVDSNTIFSTFSWLIETPAVRKNMRELMLSCELKSGLERVKKIILGEYDD